MYIVEVSCSRTPTSRRENHRRRRMPGGGVHESRSLSVEMSCGSTGALSMAGSVAGLGFRITRPSF